MSGVAHITPYALGDSASAPAIAASEGADGIDLNIRTCRANTWRPWRRRRRIVVAHWSYWWDHGFEPIPGTRVPRKKIERLKLDQVRNLRSIEGHHHILTAEQAAMVCKIHGVIPFFEMKPSVWNAEVLVALRAFCAARKIRFAVMTIQTYGRTARAKNRWERKAFQRLRLAKSVGLVTVLLYRRPLDWAKWTPVLSGIKGRRGHGPVLGITALIRRLKKEAA